MNKKTRLTIYLAVADDDHIEKKWYQRILDHDNDDDNDDKGKHREMKKRL